MRKKEVDYFICYFDEINMVLENREMDADSVINIILYKQETFDKLEVMVYYKK